MMTLDLDSRFTFDTFVIGAANRLACAATRRVAESPGSTYNPLFIYGGSGLGKTHLMTSIGHQARRVFADLDIVYDTLEHFMEQVLAAIEAGERDAFRLRMAETGLLLLDDVQFLAGRHRMQEELLRILDTLFARSGQVVLTSDRPPQEIDGLDERLLSRFSGGLIVDIGSPDYETRVAIVRRKAEERGQGLGPGVAETLARLGFTNVRELQGALHRVLAVQELEGRAVASDEVPRLLELGGGGKPDAEFDDFLSEISDAVEAAVGRSAAERQLADAILRWEGEGYRTRRLEAALADPAMHDESAEVVRAFEAAVERLREIVGQIDALEPDAPELARQELLRDPDRLEEAEALLAEVRERNRPLPAPPPGAALESLPLAADVFPVRAAAAAAEHPGEKYNPLFVHGPKRAGKTALVAAIGHRIAERHPHLAIAFLQGSGFAAEVIDALERNRLEAWRARYRRANVLILDDVDALAETERAQEELFHLFEALHRSGAQLVFAAQRAPQELAGLEERLRTRFESGLVVALPAAPAPVATPVGAALAGAPTPSPPGGEEEGAAGPDTWFQSREKILWDWPQVGDWLVEEWE